MPSQNYVLSLHRAAQGPCLSWLTGKRPRLEARVLNILASQMMDAELAALFAQEFAPGWNRLAAEQTRLQQQLLAAPPSAVRLMPNLGQAYRDALARLVEALAGAAGGEALHAARGLIERVVIHPAPLRTLSGITVEGEFAAMLMMGQPVLSAEAADKETPGGQRPPKGHRPYISTIRPGCACPVSTCQSPRRLPWKRPQRSTSGSGRRDFTALASKCRPMLRSAWLQG